MNYSIASAPDSAHTRQKPSRMHFLPVCLIGGCSQSVISQRNDHIFPSFSAVIKLPLYGNGFPLS
jgi:hypothetical protein